MGPLDAIKTGFAKSFQFKGRATRSEFWWCVGPTYLILAALLSNSSGPYTQPFWEAVWTASLYFPFLGITLFLTLGIRRSHDLGFGGMWWPAVMVMATYPILHLHLFVWPYESFGLIASLFLTPLLLAGAGVSLVFPSERKTNRFGPNPNEVPS